MASFAFYQTSFSEGCTMSWGSGRSWLDTGITHFPWLGAGPGEKGEHGRVYHMDYKYILQGLLHFKGADLIPC